MSETWPRGSEWRRWDLHLHSPGTKLADQFKATGGDLWDEYCRRLEVSDVEVFGITDYFSADGYFKTLEEFRGRYPKSKKLLLPNIELRTGDVVNPAQEEVNVHIVFNPFQQDYKKRIASFLQSLKTNKTVGGGREVRAADLSVARDFEEATTTRESILEALIDVYGKRANLTEHLLIFTAANNDGIRPERGKKRKEVITDELDKFSNGFFGNAQNVEWYLRTDRYENKEERSDQKPTLSGSDAHSLPDLDERLGKLVVKEDKVLFAPTWIKADPTFEGLRQILFEPGSRVYIGPTAPRYHDEARVIRSITLTRSNGWFDDTEIQLNPGLVSIIGQKGSGKSALAELIAYAAGGWQLPEPGSFLRRAGNHIKGLTIRLSWADGNTTTHSIGDAQSGDQRVRYLSQKFVERLCADDHVGTELIREIEAVIYEYTDPTDRLNASDFEELRASRTEGTRSSRDELQDDMARLIREECALRTNREKLPEKKARIKTLQDEETGLVKQIPKPATEEEKKAQDELQKKRAALMEAQREVAGYKQKLQKLADIKTRVTGFEGQMTRFYSDIGTLLKEAGIPEPEWLAYRPSFSLDTDTPLARKKAELEKAVTAKEGTGENPADGTIRALEKQIKALSERESMDKARQLRIKAIQTRIAAIKAEVKKLTDEIVQIEGPEKERRIKCRDERLKAYGAYFENLKLEQQALEELYKPVKKKLRASGDAGRDKDLEFSIRWDADVGQWLERGGALFDQRKTNPFGTMKELSDAARDLLLPAWMSGDSGKIKIAFEGFLEQFSAMSPRDYLRADVTVQDVLEWLYEVGHVHLNYGLKYNGHELETLSPGTKGIVLLILYLGMDTEDTRPLIVDQPDENLDSESIYDLLRVYFQSANERRQVILISHNPNLVVNADSEQVIIAACGRQQNGLPHITYQLGALESSSPEGAGIRQRTCQILEGGDVAFQRRESRYSIGKGVADKKTSVAEFD
jgi:energy-coupling factor transporter ATP-binding protein EcfA2